MTAQVVPIRTTTRDVDALCESCRHPVCEHTPLSGQCWSQDGKCGCMNPGLIVRRVVRAESVDLAGYDVHALAKQVETLCQLAIADGHGVRFGALAVDPEKLLALVRAFREATAQKDTRS